MSRYEGIMNELEGFLKEQRAKCEDLLRNSSKSNNGCATDFDGIYCWPATNGEGLVELPCPLAEQKNKSISRWCTANMSQITNYNEMAYEWHQTNATACAIINKIMADLAKSNHTPLSEAFIFNLYCLQLKLLTVIKAGYTTSIICLLIALLIFTQLHRLQNATVRIHINFFVSMAMEAFIWMTQHSIYGHRIFFTYMTEELISTFDASVPCRVLMVLGNYFELTSFTWILMESYYFYIFICREPYKGCSTIKPLLLCGWGLPIIIIIPYIIIYSISTKTNFCWVDVDIKTNLLAIPKLIMILINLCFFVMNVKVIFIKINCSVNLPQRKLHFWKWFKSTLMLMPLFGAYDIFFSVEPWIEDIDIKSKFYIALRIMCSIQGFLVTTLYCFMNNEVQSEIKRTWANWKTKRQIDCNITKRQQNSQGTRNIWNNRSTDSNASEI